MLTSTIIVNKLFLALRQLMLAVQKRMSLEQLLFNESKTPNNYETGKNSEIIVLLLEVE